MSSFSFAILSNSSFGSLWRWLMPLGLLLLAMGCGAETSSSVVTVTTTDSTDTLLESQSRGLPEANLRLGSSDTTFETRFPTLAMLMAKEEPSTLEIVKAFVATVARPEDIRTEQAFLDLLAYRDTAIIPRLDPAIYRWEDSGKRYEHFEALEAELNRLGMQSIEAEGSFLGLGPADLLASEWDRLASAELKLFLQFEELKTRAMGGEYPFLDMGGYLALAEIGEKMMALPKNRYQDSIVQDYHRYLVFIHDIHQVVDLTTREEPNMFVSGISTEHYPYLTDTRSRQVYLDEQPVSLFSKALAGVMAQPSSMSPRPEHLYLVVIAWEAEEAVARQRVIASLLKGQDVPHHLAVQLGDGSTRYAVVYRFFEEETTAEEALRRAETQFRDVELIMVSVSGDRLYQIGG